MLPQIKIVSVRGMISSGTGKRFMRSSSLEVSNLINEMDKDKKVAAIVVEINSPGGSPYPCLEISETILSVKKPVVAWVREYAASGGYWIAAACDYIVASELSHVGSIGVISLRPDFSSLMGMLGIEFDAVSTGPRKLAGMPIVPLTEEEKDDDRNERQGTIDVVQKKFTSFISQRRRLGVDATNAVSNGQLYLGVEALSLGLIDRIGMKEEAVSEAAGRAKVSNYHVSEADLGKRTLLSRLVSGYKRAPIS